MPPLLLVGVTAVLAGAALVRPVRFGLPGLVGVTILVPATLVIPNGITHLATVHRVILLAVLVGLLLAARGDEVPRSVFGMTAVHAAFAIFVTVTLLVGLGLAPAGIPLVTAFTDWIRWFDQALFFMVALALVRAADDLDRVAAWVAVVFGAAVVIAAVEQLTGASWGRWLFSRLPSQQATDAARELGFRAGQVRVRAGAEFALESAWVMLALLPTALLAARRRVPWLPTLAVASTLVMGGAVVYWTVSRSATALLPLVALAAALTARDRRIWAAVTGVLTAGALVVLAWPRLLQPLGLEADPGAAAVRTDRLPDILALAAERPVRGLGLGSLQAFGFPVTDASYLLVYAELGVIGVALLLVLLAVAVGSVARVLLFPMTSPEVRVAGVAAVGAATLVLGALVYDGLHVLGSARTFWLLVAMGVVAAERLVGPLGRPSGGWAWRLGLPAAAVAAGLAVASLYPTSHVAHYQFFSVPVEDEVAPFDPVTLGTKLLNTVCAAVDASGGRVAGARVECRDLLRGAGVGELRVVARDGPTVQAAVDEMTELARSRLGVPAFRVVVQSPAVPTRPTLADTAPVWLTLLALGAALFVPGRRRIPDSWHLVPSDVEPWNQGPREPSAGPGSPPRDQAGSRS